MQRSGGTRERKSRIDVEGVRGGELVKYAPMLHIIGIREVHTKVGG